MSSFTLQLTHNTALPRRLFEANDYTNNYIKTHNSLKKIHKKHRIHKKHKTLYNTSLVKTAGKCNKLKLNQQPSV